MKLHLSPNIENSLRAAVSQGDVDKFDELASPLKWGKPSWSVSQLLVQILDDDENRLWQWAGALSSHKNPFTRRYAPGILLDLWKKDTGRTTQILSRLAEDEDWLVREYAHSYWSELLKTDFQHVFPILEKWSASSSPNLRRCVAVAARSAGNTRNEEWFKPLVDLLAPLLPDRTPYVRKNVGPFAIGDGLLRCYPELTLKYLRGWVRVKDEGTRSNIAMAFASYGGNRNWREGLRILSDLAMDKRRYVWRAVASALIYLGRRHTEVRKMLKTWLSDPERAEVGRTALRYLTDGKAKKDCRLRNPLEGIRVHYLPMRAM
jgi:3-methyladenine DNA glycosylase AlkC